MAKNVLRATALHALASLVLSYPAGANSHSPPEYPDPISEDVIRLMGDLTSMGDGDYDIRKRPAYWVEVIFKDQQLFSCARTDEPFLLEFIEPRWRGASSLIRVIKPKPGGGRYVSYLQEWESDFSPRPSDIKVSYSSGEYYEPGSSYYPASLHLDVVFSSSAGRGSPVIISEAEMRFQERGNKGGWDVEVASIKDGTLVCGWGRLETPW